MWFANIFLLIFSLFFHHFNRLSTGQKFLMWVRYNLSIFLLMNHAFDVKSKIPRLLTSPRSKDFLLFFSKGVISLSFTFQSIFHFELIFAEGMRIRSRLSFLPMDSSWLQYCLKGHLFFHCYYFCIFVKNQLCLFILFIATFFVLFSSTAAVVANKHGLMANAYQLSLLEIRGPWMSFLWWKNPINVLFCFVF